MLRVLEEWETRFRVRTYGRGIQTGMRRVGTPNYTLRALRAGVANALIHRDYTRLEAVYVQEREERQGRSLRDYTRSARFVCALFAFSRAILRTRPADGSS